MNPKLYDIAIGGGYALTVWGAALAFSAPVAMMIAGGLLIALTVVNR